MSNFIDLVVGNKDNKPIEKYLKGFFTNKNFKEYEIEFTGLTVNQIKAIQYMFCSSKSVEDRIGEAYKLDPYCIEAFYCDYMLSDDLNAFNLFEVIYSEINKYGDFDEYRKYCFETIMTLYVKFLFDMANVTRGIKVEKMMIKITNSKNYEDIARLAFMYYVLEDYEELYRMYLNFDLNVGEYIYIILTLLKAEEDAKAKEVLRDLFTTCEYADYIDHIYDLHSDDEKAQLFIRSVNKVQEHINSVPYFYTWLNENREKLRK